MKSPSNYIMYMKDRKAIITKYNTLSSSIRFLDDIFWLIKWRITLLINSIINIIQWVFINLIDLNSIWERWNLKKVREVDIVFSTSESCLFWQVTLLIFYIILFLVRISQDSTILTKVFWHHYSVIFIDYIHLYHIFYHTELISLVNKVNTGQTFN